MTRQVDLHSLALFFGNELRLARKHKDLTQEQLAAAVNYSRSLLAQIETGQRSARPDLVRRLDDVLETHGHLARLWEMANRDGAPLRTSDLRYYEEQATTIRIFENGSMPALLQTPAYARVMLSEGRPVRVDDETLAELVTARLDRQAIFGLPEPPAVWGVLDESVLQRGFGMPEVMKGQLAHLLDLMRSRRVDLQVLTFGSGPYPATGPFRIIDRADAEPMVYVNTTGDGLSLIRPDVVRRYGEVFDILRSQALSLRDSARFVETRMAEL